MGTEVEVLILALERNPFKLVVSRRLLRQKRDAAARERRDAEQEHLRAVLLQELAAY